MPNTSSLSTAPVVEVLRLTVFAHPDERVAEPNWWSDLMGVEPEQRTSKPGRGEFQDAGPMGDAMLSLSVQPGRADWFLTPGQFVPGTELVAEIRSVGVFPDKFGEFVGLMSRWLPSAPRVVRLAFGAVVFVPTESKESGYRMLSGYLPSVKIDPVGSEDLLYQINRPRNSVSITGLRMNRLSKWSVAYFQRFRVGIPVPSQGIQGQLGDRVHACRIELDMSTSTDMSDALPADHLNEIFRELVNLASEIAQKGDIA